MEIDRKNYEIWFIDWLDGNLSQSQVEKLNLFLEENPDLREELNEIKSYTTNTPGESIKLENNSFHDKDRLKKSPSDISESQFEYLCVAFLENDLSSAQKDELREIIEKDPDKRRTFEVIQKTRIKPVAAIYPHKRRLVKRTVAQKIIRLSVIGLSAAAVIIPVLTYIIIPHNSVLDSKGTTLNIAGNKILKSSPEITEVKKPDKYPARQSKEILATINKRNSSEPINKIDSSETKFLAEEQVKDTSANYFNSPDPLLSKVSVKTKIAMGESIPGKALVVSNLKFRRPVEDSRSNIGRFLARTVRGKILKEKISNDSPLRGYEIAEAGVAELNKLLGWEMALKENNDENGNLKSVYFSSKILKFNAPVKKSEPLQ